MKKNRVLEWMKEGVKMGVYCVLFWMGLIGLVLLAGDYVDERSAEKYYYAKWLAVGMIVLAYTLWVWLWRRGFVPKKFKEIYSEGLKEMEEDMERNMHYADLRRAKREPEEIDYEEV